MCGIAAIFSYRNGPPISEPELLAIRDRMHSRGPDGAGIWISDDQNVGLAHRRLSIIDLSTTGAQPMFDETGRFGISFNGEIYNYRELRAELQQKGVRFRSTSDTEVLLHLYAERGPEMLACLRGMYAFAIWDDCKKSLFLARDPYGIKPLYYADNGITFRAASQVKALLAGGSVDTSPNPAGHAGFFLWGHVPDPHTFYRGIRAIPAGHYITIELGKTPQEMVFCSLPHIFADAGHVNGRHSCKDAVREALHDTVRQHLVADVPVGVFLSSGVDSTIIAALAAEEGGTLKTVTLGFDEYKGTSHDEAPLAEAVARQYGSDHRTVHVTKTEFESQFDHLMWSMDQPTTDGVNSYWVSRAAQQAGLKVALSGLGGDELFGGYPSFSQIPKLVRALRPFERLKPLGRGLRVLSAPLLKQWASPKYAGLLEYGGSYSGAYLLRRGMFMPWELPDVLDADFARDGWNQLQAISALESDISQIPSSRARLSCLESCWYMRDRLLRDSDWAGMAHALEIRVPLVDLGLLHATGKWISNGEPPTKQTMLQAPLWPLPDEIATRPKTGFTVPIRQWLLPRTGGASTDGSGMRAWARLVYKQFSARNVR